MTDGTEQPEMVADDAIVNDNVADDVTNNDEGVGTVDTQDNPEVKNPDDVPTITQAQANKIITDRLKRQERQIRGEYEKAREDKRPNVPDLPDPYDVEKAVYEKAVKERDNALVESAKWDYQQAQKNESKQQTEKQQFTDSVQRYKQAAQESKINPTEAVEAIITLHGDDVAVAMFNIASELDNGPAVMDYLAKNPTELNQVRDMPAMAQAIYIATKIAPKAASRPQTKTPPPVTTQRGGGYSYKDAGLASGGKFT